MGRRKRFKKKKSLHPTYEVPTIDQAMPPCPVFEQCGGCVYQDQNHAFQVKKKLNFFKEHLDHYDVIFPREEIDIVFGEAYNYRNRMDFAFFSQDGNLGLGQRKAARYNQYVPIHQCEISLPTINTYLQELWDWLREVETEISVHNIDSHQGCFKYAVIRKTLNTDSGNVSFVLNRESENLMQQKELIERFSAKTSCPNVMAVLMDSRRDMSYSPECEVIKGVAYLEETLSEKKLRYHSQSFFQNNPLFFQRLINHMKDLVQKYNLRGKWLDFYGGAGTLGISLVDHFDHLTIVDIDSQNIELAKENIELNQLSHKANALTAEAKEMERLDIWDGEFNMILDPPRSGLQNKNVRKVKRLSPCNIFYVSCHPKQLAMELKLFEDEYELLDLKLFDLFPQTPHYEAIAYLKRRHP